MSIPNGRHVMADCKCGRCGKMHRDIVSFRDVYPVKDRFRARNTVVCDACYLRDYGSAAHRAYLALRKMLGGD